MFLGIEGLRPVMQMQIKLHVDAKDGEPVRHTIYNSSDVVSGRSRCGLA